MWQNWYKETLDISVYMYEIWQFYVSYIPSYNYIKGHFELFIRQCHLYPLSSGGDNYEERHGPMGD